MKVMYRSRVCRRRVLALAQFVTFALFLGLAAPHSVHHLFQEPTQTAKECTLFTASSKNSSLACQQVEWENGICLEGDLGPIPSHDLHPQRLITDHSGRSPPQLPA
jgi:hypothetical protein